MKTFEEILQLEYGTEDDMQFILPRLYREDIQKCVNEFATEVAKEALKRAAENADTVIKDLENKIGNLEYDLNSVTKEKEKLERELEDCKSYANDLYGELRERNKYG